MAFIIGIAGGSGSGKTTIAARAARLLAAPLIAEDDYYHCRTTFVAFDEATHDFDAPESKDQALLVAHLTAARRGESFAKPLYDFTRHARRGDVERIAAAPFLLIEGLHAFASPDLRAAIDLAVYVDAEETVRLQRRIERDVRERGRSEAFVRAQFARTVIPAHRASVAPQRETADVVIDTTEEHDLIRADVHAAHIAAEARRRSGA
ncbi:MAG: AAA family ATPase [Alphaproteobacteria bacterium]|nr:AAA family ATPase [Alphaproteobacteria bacterium]